MSFVQTEIADGVATVSLDDPDRRNALNAGWSTEIVATFDALEADADVGAVVVTGAGAGVLRRRRPRRTSASSDGGPSGLRDDLRGLPARRALAAADHRRGQRRRGRRRHEPGARVRRAPRRDARPGSTPGSSSSASTPAAATPGCCSASPARRPRRPRCCSARCSTAPRPSGVGLVWRCVADDELLDGAQAMAARAAAAPPRARRSASRRTLARRGRASTTHDAAVDRELEPQVWSMRAARVRRAPRRPPGQDHREVSRRRQRDPGRASERRRGARPTPRR